MYACPLHPLIVEIEANTMSFQAGDILFPAGRKSLKAKPARFELGSGTPMITESPTSHRQAGVFLAHAASHFSRGTPQGVNRFSEGPAPSRSMGVSTTVKICTFVCAACLVPIRAMRRSPRAPTKCGRRGPGPLDRRLEPGHLGFDTKSRSARQRLCRCEAPLLLCTAEPRFLVHSPASAGRLGASGRD